jgi:hypothetical protein
MMRLIETLLAALAAQSGMASTSTAPPPAVTVAAPVPPPIVAVMPSPPPLVRVSGQMPPAIVVPLHVRVAAGKQLLFEDTMRIARGAGASFSQNRSEAPAALCPTDRFYGYGERQSLNVQLNLRGEYQAEDPGVNVSVTWQRPSGSADCGPDGSRSVSLSETVELKPGQSATVHGDADLTVTLSRR